MIQFSRAKTIFVLFICFLGFAYAMPNVMSQQSREWLQSNFSSWLPNKTVNLGLDLQGGSHILMDVGVDTVFRDHMESMKDSARQTLREERIGYSAIRVLPDYSMNVVLREVEQGEEARRILRGIDPMAVVGMQDERTVTFTLTDNQFLDLKNQAIAQSIEIVRRRIDETGTREPIIQRQGDRRILIQLPGVDDPARVKELLGKTAKLGFHLVDERATQMQRQRPGTFLFPYEESETNARAAEQGRPTSLGVERKAIITGEMLDNAQPAFQEGMPVVSFRLNAIGARRFCDVSRENVGRPFAIVLDKKIISAPVIREAICGGQGQISGSFTVEQVNDLAVLLRAGALPAPMTIAEERSVGPSLGADSVEAGKNASIVALIAVITFMVVAYGLYGVFACIALTVNIALIFAMLSGLQATLTLPGIAGIVLTIGMAVDANVLIFERIREEFKAGRSLMSAIDSGYSRAMATIMDANITTLIAAVLLYSFGTGPVKGFAVTLAIGILTSLFSAIMVTRLLVVNWLLKGKKKTELPLV
jgi:protein-export membrane protein SecD